MKTARMATTEIPNNRKVLYVFTATIDQSMCLNVGFSLCMAPQFLSHHGGSSNACTSAEYTTFFFDVAQEHLCGALDRLVPGQVGPRIG